MSTAMAIASVTQVLRDLLNNGLIDNDVASAADGSVKVTAWPPDRIDTSPGHEQSQLNLFMFQATENLGWRNAELPSRDGSGSRVSNPPLALDLHYLLTAYGASELHAEILLGYGMQLLHENPVLPREAIRRALAPQSEVPGGGLPSGLKSLATSNLAEQIEQVKVTPESLTTEEISRLWSAFQAKYRPTSAYQATVVLIESDESTKNALPVRERKLYVMPFKQPVIDKIMSQAKEGDPIVEDQPILEGYRLAIVGRQLRGEHVSVDVGGIESTPATKDISDTRILIELPAGLEAGVQGVQVIHRQLMGSPPEPHRGVGSNVAAFVLCPRVVGTISATSTDVSLTVKPAVGDRQRAVLLLNELKPAPASPPSDEPPRAYSFKAIPGNLLSPPRPADELFVPIKGVVPGAYLARIQVDGAESPLGADAEGRFDSPKVTIPA